MNEETVERGTEERILEAATRIFLQKGMAGARMAEIAENAGINKALLHYYFRSKGQLYGEVCSQKVESFFRDLLGSIPVVEDIEEFLVSIINNYIDRLAMNPQVVRFLTWEISSGGSVVREVIKKVVHEGPGRSVYSTYSGIVDRAIASGTIRSVDPTHLLMSILGMCLYVFLAAPILVHVFPGLEVDDPSFIEKRKREIFMLVWKGIRSEGSGTDA